MATVVFRNGAFSLSDSNVWEYLGKHDETQPFRLVAFRPKGQLRPDATNTLVVVNGRTLRWVGDQWPMRGHNGPATIVPGQPFVSIGDLVYRAKNSEGYSNDIHNSKNVAFAVHICVRLVELDHMDPRYPQLHDVKHSSSISRDLPIKLIDEILGAPVSVKKPEASF